MEGEGRRRTKFKGDALSLLVERALLRVGKIDFLNTLPFFYSWDDQNPEASVRFVKGSPQDINRKMKEGEIDVGLASSLAYALNPKEFLILPGFCIGAYQKSRSVTLYSSKPIESLNGKKIYLSSKSLSAASLLKVLLKFRWGFHNEFEDASHTPMEMLARYSAFLLIGDEALFFRPGGMFVYDLSEMWWEWTGYPFCFALWTVRRSIFEKLPSQVTALSEVLGENLNRNLNRLHTLADKIGIESSKKDIVVEYLQSLEYRLTDQVQKGLSLFYEYAHKMGIISQIVPMSFCQLMED